MTAAFDPYHQWLGIPAAEQPPHHYRLLGLTLYESNQSVIDQAADRQMTFVQMHKTGPHSDASQRLLNELAVARRVLLNADKKAAYDAELRTRAAATAPVAAGTMDPFGLASHDPFAPLQAIPTVYIPAPPGLTTPTTRAEFDVGLSAPFAAGSSGARSTQARPASHAKSPPTTWIAGAATGVLIGLLAAWGIAGSGSQGGPEVAARTPSAELSVAAAPIATADAAPRAADRIESPVAASPDVASRGASDSRTTPSADLATETTPPARERPKFSAVAPSSAEPAVAATSPVREPATQPAVAHVVSAAASDSAFDPLADGDAVTNAVPPRLPVPTGETLAGAEKHVREAFAKEIAAAQSRTEHTELAKQLYKPIEAGEDDPAIAYALLELSWKNAAQGRDAWYACMVIDQAAKRYELDALALKESVLSEVGPTAAQPDHHGFFADAWLKLSAEATAAHEFEAAHRFALQAESAAKRSQNDSLVKRAAQARTQTLPLQQAFAKAQPAKLALQENPDDAKAAAQWGRFVAFYATDFAQGLPLLARGDDELATIARQELARPKDAAARTAIGDGWRSLAAAEPDDRAKKAAATRAAGWYRKALPDLYGLSRKQVELRLAEVEAVVPPLPLGEWVDLIPSFLIDERGAWSRRDDVLGVFRESRWDKCPAPFIPEGSYELRVRFRFPGEAQLFRIRSPAGSGCCVVAFWDFSGAGHRITTLAEERLPGSNASPPTPEAVSRREYVAGVAVTVRGERVRIVGTLDGRQVSAWEGPAATLGDNPRDSRQVRCLRLETQGHPVEVTEVQIRVKDGRIRQGTE